MRTVEIDGPEAFLERASPLLLADEARHNLMLGIGALLVDTPDYYPEARFWVVEERGQPLGAALRTPPHNLLVAQQARADAVPALVSAIEDDPPGVTGGLPEAEDVASAWVAAHGGRWAPRMAMRIHALRAVRTRGNASGGMRTAGTADRELAIAWWHAFADEALEGHRAERGREAVSVDHRLSDPDCGIRLWVDGGEVVSLAAYGGPTPNGIRIGPVYTPPGLRGRGYATSLVATLSEELLAGGRRFCFLYTDLANPTSNRIYARIGYEPVCDSTEITFTA